MRLPSRWLLAVLAFALAGCGAPAPDGGRPADPAPDPLQDQQWVLDVIHAEEAWAHATGKGVLVAVLDTGVATAHPDLQGRLDVRDGADLVDPGSANGPEDECVHGTAMAGIVAAGRNGVGLVGVAPDATILPVRVTNDCRATEVPQETVLTLALLEARVADGIRYAADQGAQVISMSFVRGPALPGGSLPMDEAIAYAWSKGAVLVAGAGNNGLPMCYAPAANPQVLCVGATTRDDAAAAYSNTDGAGHHIMAPGGGPPVGRAPGAAGSCAEAVLVLDTGLGRTCSPAPGYFAANGTSVATPVVAGVAAVLVELGLDNEQVVQRLKASSVDLGPAGQDAMFGWGRVDALAAVTAA